MLKETNLEQRLTDIEKAILIFRNFYNKMLYCFDL